MRAVVVVAGLPGAGKTTLVSSVPGALDSDAVREAWAARLGRIPYPLWRPLVHARHWLAIWSALRRPEGVIVVRPFTSGRLRRAVLRRARRHHHAVHLVVVDATPAQARAGQRARGRAVGERAMRRHERRWARADFAREGWTTVNRVVRTQATPSLLSADSRAPWRASAQTNHQEERIPMLSNIRKTAIAIAALAALALGGAAIAGAADKANSTSGTQARPQRDDNLSGDTAAKVKAAALEKVPGATVLETEAGGPYSTPYHAHVRTSDGTLKVVLVNAQFEATAVQADNGRRGRGDRDGDGPGGHGGPGRGETALTGDTKKQVEAAVLAKYPGAKIVRTETNGDSAAPYESHITTSAGKELEVLVSKDFKVVDAR
jgi:uncharacterized membrane protein YkoI